MIETLISFKIKVWSKSIDNQAVFTKTEINKEWNVNFLKNKDVIEKYQQSSCIYQDRNEQLTNRWFFTKYNQEQERGIVGMTKI